MPGNDPRLERAQRRLGRGVSALLCALVVIAVWITVDGANAGEERSLVGAVELWRAELQHRADGYAAEAAFEGEILRRTRAGTVDVIYHAAAADADTWVAAGCDGFDPASALIEGMAVSRTAGAVAWSARGPRLIAVRGEHQTGILHIAIGPLAPELVEPFSEDGALAIVDRHERIQFCNSPAWAEKVSQALLGSPLPVDKDDVHAGGLSGTGAVIMAPLFDIDQWDITATAVIANDKGTMQLRSLEPVGYALIALVCALGSFAVARRRLESGARFPGLIVLAGGCIAFASITFLGFRLSANPQPLERALHDWLAAIATQLPHRWQFTTSLELAAVIALIAGATAIALYGLTLIRKVRTAAAMDQATAAALFLTPALVFLTVFFIGPVLFALTISFFDWDIVGVARRFIALGNYVELFGDPLFWKALWNTLFYTLHVPVAMALALAIALPLQRNFRGVTILRTLFFLPYITSFVAISTVWQWLYNTEFGLLNYLLSLLGLGPVNWLSDPNTAMLAVMVMSIWLQIGYMMVVFIAGLQSIPSHLYEAATLDGAGRWAQFRRITLPLLRPTVFFVLVTSIINSFQVFTYVYVMTQGGPLHGTEVLVYQIYKNAWEYYRMGYASAAAWVLFVLIMLVTLVQFTWFRKRIEEVGM